MKHHIGKKIIFTVLILLLAAGGGLFAWMKIKPTKIALVNFSGYKTAPMFDTVRDKFIQVDRVEWDDRIGNTLKKYPYLILEEDGEVKGYAYAGVFKDRAAYDHSCELSIYLDRSAKGRGYGRKLYEALEEKLKGHGIRNLYACIGDPIGEDPYLTKDSEEFHRHLGFVKVGEFHKCGYKFGRWYNMIWMEKIIS